MKLRVTLMLPHGGMRDITVSCDVTATVSDAARALIRAGASGEPRLERIAEQRLAPLTLRGRPGGETLQLLLDPGSPIASSGIQAGWTIQAVPEFAGHGAGIRRLIEAAGYVEVLSGKHAGAHFSLLPGANLIGRNKECRVHLSDGSVSRRHAVIEIRGRRIPPRTPAPGPGTGSESTTEITLEDLGSANGLIVEDTRVVEHLITAPCTVVLGDVTLRILPGPPPVAPPELSHRVMHTRAPRIDPRFPSTERELPAPPAPAAPSRIPMLAMLAPIMMGGAMYAITGSPMSLMMIAFSPLMMIGSWLDGRIGGKRKLRRELRQFTETLDAERVELRELRDREIEIRATETPTTPEIIEGIATRSSLLWARRPEHRSFLELRFGEGTLPSRTVVRPPPRGDASHEQWKALCRVEREFRDATPVPVIERLDRCGSIGVSGEPAWTEGMTRALLLQLVGLHSPAELSLACFAGPRHTAEWDWLKWLPHIDAATSPLPVWQLADDAAGSNRLIAALEGLLAARRSGGGTRRTVRSHLDADNRNDDVQGEAVRELPVTPIVIVLVLDDGQVERSRLISLAEDGPDCGIHLLWVGRHRGELPAACRTFADIGQAEGSVGFVRTGTIAQLSRLEWVDAPMALELARSLAPVEDTSARVLDESDLPKTVNLRDLHTIDLLGGAQPILQAWAASGTLTARWRLGAERPQIDFAAVVGQGPDGPAVVDLRTHGPHALVGGTTGSGKSEFLQSWIMSMAARVSPDRLTFLLVDYKGGAAFAECVDLPHTVGLVTDLSPHLVRRALTSLRAELHHREELLAAHGAKDLISMERRSDADAPPALVIVIDEFAALAGEVPEFVDGVIDIAQRGRSLGLHLIMATQRPAGVIKDNLRANTNLRVALRMADESDSSDVIGAKDAAFFDAEMPGRGAIKVGPGRIAHFQTGYLGERAAAVSLEAHIDVRSLNFCEGAPWDIPPEPVPSLRESGAGPRDIEQLRDGIIAAAGAAGLATPRRPWLDELPERIDLAELGSGGAGARRARRGRVADDEPESDAPVIGLRDDPAAQLQCPISVDFDEVGNVAITGAGGTGKTSTLLTLTSALSAETSRWPVQLYAIDAAGGALDSLRPLPTVGAVAPLPDMELVTRVLRRLLDLIAERGPRYAAARTSSLRALRRTPGNRHEPRVILLLDGFSAFRQATETLGGGETPFQMLGEIMMTGRAVGVHVVITGDRPSAIPAAMTSSLQRQYVLRLANAHDYGHLGLKGDALEGSKPGRALAAGDDREIHFALVGGRTDLAEQAIELERLAGTLEERGISQVPEVVNAPETIPLAELPAEVNGRPVYGIDTSDFAPVGLPLAGLGVIAGSTKSGQSTAALACLDAVVRHAQARDERVESILLSFAEDGLGSRRAWSRVASGEDEVAAAASYLVGALGGKPAARAGFGGGIGQSVSAPGTSPVEVEVEAEPFVFPSSGARGVIVVERPAVAEGGDALPALVALARAARRSGVLVLFEFEQGTGSAIWDLFAALKQPNWGLALQPDAVESQSPFREPLGRVRRADFPPGRGFAIESGRVRPVHVALPMTEESKTSESSHRPASRTDGRDSCLEEYGEQAAA